MFPNCIDCFGHQKKKKQHNKETKKKQEKINNKKMGIIVPTMNHYPRNGQEGDPEFSTR